jgi:hypothetical protein
MKGWPGMQYRARRPSLRAASRNNEILVGLAFSFGVMLNGV